MACFLVPVAEAVVTAVVSKVVKSIEKDANTVEILNENGEVILAEKLPFSKKLSWLSNLLWGGSALLAFEHIWHGELAPFFPFFTNAVNSESFAEMLHEMSTVGVSMAVLVTVVWLGMVAVSSVVSHKAVKAAKNLKTEENA